MVGCCKTSGSGAKSCKSTFRVGIPLQIDCRWLGRKLLQRWSRDKDWQMLQVSIFDGQDDRVIY